MELPRDHELSLRCALLQLWSGALQGLLAMPPVESMGGNKLHDRLRAVVGKMTEAELGDASLVDHSRSIGIAANGISAGSVSRTICRVAACVRQIELRLQRARQLLADPNAKHINVAYNSGYRHLGLPNAMF